MIEINVNRPAQLILEVQNHKLLVVSRFISPEHQFSNGIHYSIYETSTTLNGGEWFKPIPEIIQYIKPSRYVLLTHNYTDIFATEEDWEFALKDVKAAIALRML